MFRQKLIIWAVRYVIFFRDVDFYMINSLFGKLNYNQAEIMQHLYPHHYLGFNFFDKCLKGDCIYSKNDVNNSVHIKNDCTILGRDPCERYAIHVSSDHAKDKFKGPDDNIYLGFACGGVDHQTKFCIRFTIEDILWCEFEVAIRDNRLLVTNNNSGMVWSEEMIMPPVPFKPCIEVHKSNNTPPKASVTLTFKRIK